MVNGVLRKVAASVATLVATVGLATFATTGSFGGEDPFPHSVVPDAADPARQR